MFARKNELFDQDGVNDTVLARSADDPGASHISLDDCALCQEVPPDVVRVCAVRLDRLNLRLTCLAGFGVRDRRVVYPKSPDLPVAPVGADDLLAFFTDVRLCGSSSDLRSLLALGGVIASTRRLPN